MASEQNMNPEPFDKFLLLHSNPAPNSKSEHAVESDAAVSQLLIQQNALQNELKRIDKTLLKILIKQFRMLRIHFKMLRKHPTDNCRFQAGLGLCFAKGNLLGVEAAQSLEKTRFLTV